MDPKKVGEFLKSLRKAKGLTQLDVAEALFVSQKTVSRWETGECIPEITILSSVANFFGITIDELLEGERNFSEAGKLTKRLSLEDKNRLVRRNVNSTLNLYLAFSLGFAGLLFAIGLISILYDNALFLLFNAFSLLVAPLIYVSARKILNSNLANADIDIYGGDFKPVVNTIMTKDLVFYDIYMVLWIMCAITELLQIQIIIDFDVARFVIDLYFYLTILACLLITRPMLKVGRIDHATLKKYLLRCLCLIMPVLFLSFVNIGVNGIGGNYTYSFLAVLMPLKDNATIVWRIIGTSVIGLSSIAAIVLVFKQSLIASSIFMVLGLIGNFLPLIDFKGLDWANIYLYVSHLGLFTFLIALVLLSFVIYCEVKINRNKKYY